MERGDQGERQWGRMGEEGEWEMEKGTKERRRKHRTKKNQQRRRGVGSGVV